MQIDWTNPTVQGAFLAGLIGIAGVIVAALAGFGGAVLGSWISARAARAAATLAKGESEADRVEARQARLAERTLELASTVLAQAERHKHEIGVQFRSWNRAAAEGLNPDGVISEVGPTEAILDAVGGLYIVASQGTADAAWDLYTACRNGLDRWVYVADRHRRGDRVDAPSHEHLAAINDAFLLFDARKTLFLNAVRVELGRPPLAPAAEPFPDEPEVIAAD